MFAKVGVRGRSRGYRRRVPVACRAADGRSRGCASVVGESVAAQVTAEREGVYDAGAGDARAVVDDLGSAAGGVDGLPPSVGEALGLLEAAVEAVAAVDTELEGARGLLDGVVGLHLAVERLTAQQVRLVGVAERREAYGVDGSVAMAAWLRGRTRVDHAAAVRTVMAARRLERLPGLRAAFEAGEVTFAHVTAVTDAAVPSRIEAIAACEGTLVELARRARPRDVRRALQRIRELADPDGSDSPPLDEHGLDERRYLDASRTVDGMVHVEGMLDQLQGERLLTIIDAFTKLDPAGTPAGKRRTAGQRRADALDAALARLLDRGDTPVVGGNKPHVVCTIDLETLLGHDAGQAAGAAVGAAAASRAAAGFGDQGTAAHAAGFRGQAASGAAGFGGPAAAGEAAEGLGGQAAASQGAAGQAAASQAAAEASAAAAGFGGQAAASAAGAAAVFGGRERGARLRHTGELDAERARALARDAKVQAILTLGPWRVVNVGRTHRTLPAWLRYALELVHRHCRGPDCDRPITWTEAHHIFSWTFENGETDLNRMVPLCLAHHEMVTSGGWRVDFDPDTGVCTWHGPDAQTIHVPPPTP